MGTASSGRRPLRFCEGGDRTLPGLVRRGAERNGDKIAVRTRDAELTYAAAYHDARCVAGGLHELGVAKGTPVAVLMGNSLDFLRVWFGINQAGAVEVPINPAYRGDGLHYLLEHAQAEILIVDEELLEPFAAVADRLTHVRHVVVRGEASELPKRVVVHDFEQLRASDPAPDPRIAPPDLAAIMYTSGTTGPPKGVMLPHGASCTWAEQFVEQVGKRGAAHYCCFPLFHTLAQYFAVMPTWASDHTLAVSPRFSASSFWDDIRFFGAGSANLLGSLITLLHARAPSPDDGDNPLELGFGGPSPVAIIDDFERRFGLTFFEIYGSSEANVVLWNTTEDRRTGSCGKPIARFDVKVVDELDEEVPDDVVGEFIVRSREPFGMMSGYYRNAGATVEAFRNLWFHTGDLGRRDADGYHYFVDRRKDAIRRRGENISSWEVEMVLTKHPAVAECAAFGVPSELTEEDVMVVVARVEGGDVTPEELIEFCEGAMPRYMVPRYIEVVDELPHTETGKVEKFRLRDRGPSAATWDRQRAGETLT